MTPNHRPFEQFIVLVILYSVATYFAELEFGAGESGAFFLWSERIVAAIFTIEYAARWVASGSLAYPLRPMAIADLAALLPFYLSALVDLRTLRLLRALRFVKLFRYTDAVATIRNAFFQVRYEFAVIGFAVLALVWLCAAAVYECERDAQPQNFARLSDALWYTLTTVTTVGYGDKVPVTAGGKLVAGFLMVGGLGLFGTFVSLIGSAFLEELRKRPAASLRATADVLVGAAPDGPGSFCPATVLRSIEAGAFNRGNDPQTVRLLGVACRILVARESAASGK